MKIPLLPDHIEFSHESEVVDCMEDLTNFLSSAKETPRDFKWAVMATFSAVQSAMVIARGPDAITEVSEKSQEKKKNSKNHLSWVDPVSVKHFQTLYNELKEEQNWHGTTSQPWSISTSQDYSIRTLKGIRDDLEHPKYTETVYPCLMIRQGIRGGVDFLEYLLSRSDPLKERIGDRLQGLLDMIEDAKGKLEPVGR